MAAILVLAAPLHAATRPATQPSTQRTMAADVSVDPRAELMSVIFRLAGNPEYNRAKVDSYSKDADKHFAAFKDHAAVKLARKLRENRGISYNAPMSLAPYLAEDFALKEKVALDPRPEGLDARWQAEDVRAFLEEAQRFAEQSRFKKFCQDHQGLYRTAVERMGATMARHGHLEWFDTFFGRKPGARFHIWLGMLNGGCCYATSSSDGKETDLYCILGAWLCDANGVPEFPASLMPTIAHEFAHSYANPAVAAHAKDLEPAGKKIFPQVKDAMARQAYGNWQTVVSESVVRASVIRYCSAHVGGFAATTEAMKQQRLGFAWMSELVGLLGQYESQRDKYPTLDSFMPRIVQFFDQYAGKLP
jgi:hypothetical protein